MPQIEITITEVVDVPEGTTVVLAKTGMVAGLRLPTGDFLKPWITHEHYKAGDEDGDPVNPNIAEADLNELNVFTGLDYERTVNVIDDGVATDDSAVAKD